MNNENTFPPKEATPSVVDAHYYDPMIKQKAAAKLSRIPIKVQQSDEVLKKPDWIRVKATIAAVKAKPIIDVKKMLRALYPTKPVINHFVAG